MYSAGALRPLAGSAGDVYVGISFCSSAVEIVAVRSAVFVFASDVFKRGVYLLLLFGRLFPLLFRFSYRLDDVCYRVGVFLLYPDLVVSRRSFVQLVEIFLSCLLKRRLLALDKRLISAVGCFCSSLILAFKLSQLSGVFVPEVAGKPYAFGRLVLLFNLLFRPGQQGMRFVGGLSQLLGVFEHHRRYLGRGRGDAGRSGSYWAYAHHRQHCACHQARLRSLCAA